MQSPYRLARSVAGRAVRSIRAAAFRPFVEPKCVEGVSFDFLVGDLDARSWYGRWRRDRNDPEWLELRYVKEHLVRPGDTVLEAGGHHGFTAVLLSAWVGPQGRVVTFEANPANARILEENVRLNRLANVTVERKAVGAGRGEVRVSRESNGVVQRNQGGRAVAVEMVPLDDYASLRPALLKIDVEGYEVEVLKGASRILAMRPKLAIEIHPRNLALFGSTIPDLLRLIDLERYECWVQWVAWQLPEPFDGTQPIAARVHLFAVPRS